MNDILDGFVPYVHGKQVKKGDIGKPPRNELTGKPGCYVAADKVNGNLYVGSTSNLAGRIPSNLNKLKYGKHHNSSLQEAYNENPDISIIVKQTDTTEEAMRLEQEIVNKFLPTGKLHNVGTDDVTRPALGLSVSEDRRKKIGDASRGQKRSEETRLKNREAQLGKSLSDEHKQKQSIAQKDYLSTEEGKAAHARAAEKLKKPVICKGVTYTSQTEAAKALGVDVTTISYRCKSDNFPDFTKPNKNI